MDPLQPHSSPLASLSASEVLVGLHFDKQDGAGWPTSPQSGLFGKMGSGLLLVALHGERCLRVSLCTQMFFASTQTLVGRVSRVWQVLVDLRSRGVGVLVTGEHRVPTGTVIEQHKIINNGNFEPGE